MTATHVIDEPSRRLDEGTLRALVPRVLAGLVLRGEEFEATEDTLQEALLESALEGEITDPDQRLSRASARTQVPRILSRSMKPSIDRLASLDDVA